MTLMRSRCFHWMAAWSLCLLMVSANSAWAAETLEFSIRWDTNDERYHVFMRPTSTPTPNISMTGQVTVRVPHGLGADRFTVNGLTSTVNDTFWLQNSRADKPDEALNSDYLSFTLTAMNTAAFNWQPNVEQEVFSFGNSASCNGAVELISDNDPFNQIPNSRGTSPGNQFTNIGWGGFEGNNYMGIYGTAADCNNPPTVTSANSATVPENTSGTALDISSSDDTDSEGAGITYSLTGNGADDSLFTLNPTSGVLSFSTAPDFENPADSDGDNVYTLEAQVCDSDAQCTTQTISLTVSDVNENTAPVITSANSATVPENTSGTVLDVSSSDDTDSESTGLTYSLTGNGADDSLFTLNPTSGVLSFSTAPDFESPTDSDGNNVYTIEVEVCDSGALCATQTISLTVSDTNENIAPVISSANSANFAENATGAVLNVETTDDSSSEATETITYSLSGNDDDALFSINPLNGEFSFNNPPDYENPLDSDGNNTYQLTVNACDAETSCSDQTITVSIINDAIIRLQLRTYLQGAYDSGSGMMDEMLRTLDLLPTAQPYSTEPFNYAGAETLSPAVVADAANAGDNVVDWVLAELRSAVDPLVIIASQALMVQRDGDLVNPATGSAELTLGGVAEGDYYVSIRHRNHLAVLTLNTVALSESGTLVDFTLPATPVVENTVNNPARLETSGVSMMWAGDANQNQNIIAYGEGNDGNSILTQVLLEPANGVELNSNYVLYGYHHTDLNMDGMALFAGADNDINILIGNIMLHPNNGSLAANFILTGSIWSLENPQ